MTTSIQFRHRITLLSPVKQWLNKLEIHATQIAQQLCQLIPAQCPFERNVKLWNYTLHIPPLCKLNPLYEELIGLRFCALSYLVDECSQDVM